MKQTTFLGALALLALPFFGISQDVQWRGPNRDGIFAETGLLKQWPENGPELLLKVDNLGDGWSSPVIHNNIIYLTGKVDTMDVLSAIKPDGTLLWQKPFGRAWEKTYPDTRTSPTIEGNRAYLASGMGEVVCFDIETGNIIWKQNAFEDNGGSCGAWGIAESILMVDDKVVFTTGGNQTLMVAFNKLTGEYAWKSKTLNDDIGYVSPILVEMNGKRQIVNISAKFIFGIEPQTGELVWSFNYHTLDDSEWDNGGGVINCTSPIFSNGYLYVTSGYNHTGAKFKMKDDLSGVDFLWKEETLDNHHGGVILLDGKVYGSNWVNNNQGNWCCIDFETGKTLWEENFDTKGSIVSADGMLYIYTERRGNVALVKPNAEKFEMISSFRITEGNGPHWAHPTINDGKLYIRHGKVMLVYDVKQHP